MTSVFTSSALESGGSKAVSSLSWPGGAKRARRSSSSVSPSSASVMLTAASGVILESIGAFDHLDALNAVIDAEFFEDIKAIHHIAEGGIASVHEVETSRGELCFVEEQEELRRPIAKSLVGMGPPQSPKG